MFNIKKWLAQRKLNQKIKHASETCDGLFQSISSFHLAKESREDQQLFSYEYIYGEINDHTLAILLSYCTIHSNSVFFDLGAGAGKAVIFASLLHDFKTICGVERLKKLHDCSVEVSSKIPDKDIRFFHDDLLTHPWQEADIIYVNAATFVGEFWNKVLLRLDEVLPGSQVIIIGKQLPDNDFELIHEDILPMSWGASRAGVYRKRPKNPVNL